MLPSYRHATLYKVVIDPMERFEPGIIPQNDSSATEEIERWVKSLLTHLRSDIHILLKDSIRDKQNLWIVAENFLPDGFRKPAAVIARLGFLREKAMFYQANIEQWRAEDNEDNDCGRTFQRRAVHFFQFVDSEIKKVYESGGWAACRLLSVQPRTRTSFGLTAWLIRVGNVVSQTRSTPWRISRDGS